MSSSLCPFDVVSTKAACAPVRWHAPEPLCAVAVHPGFTHHGRRLVGPCRSLTLGGLVVTLSLATLVLAPACQRVPVQEEPESSSAVALSLTTSMELRASIPEGLVFLPPIVRPIPAPGDCLSDLPISVRIDEIDARGRVIRSLASFTQNSGPSGEPLRFHARDARLPRADSYGDPDPQAYYYARWILDDANLSPNARYRINVVVPARQDGTRDLGYTEVAMMPHLRAVRRVDDQGYRPLSRGNILPIKFRISAPAVDRDRDGVYDWMDNCPSIGNPDQLDSMQNGVGDACRCLPVKCTPLDPCHARGVCQPSTGTCTNPSARNGVPCHLAGAVAQCQDGQCQMRACVPSHGDCNGQLNDGCETSLAAAANCGECGNLCPEAANSLPVCRGHSCGIQCHPGFRDCDRDTANGCETDIRSDAQNCGRCARACHHQEGCSLGQCTTQVCQAGFADCDGKARNGCEVDLNSHADHCGACGAACATANGTSSCSGGICGVESCDSGFADCNLDPVDGCETAIATDTANCGECGNRCRPPHAASSCVAGSCRPGPCDAGYADCDGDPVNGCEVDLTSDARSCAACGNACVFPHASPVCSSGHCGIAACAAGFADCDGLPGNGCETDIRSSLTDCGACGTVCLSGAHSAPACQLGRCGLVCDAGLADCDGVASNGCETDLLSNPASCGACGRVCHTVDGACQMGACSSFDCAPGYGDCNEDPADGCETALATDANNCGSCGSSCQRPNVVRACTNGQCDFSLCQPGFADCDGVHDNGCEANLDSDIAHCGACDTVCYDNNICTIDTCTGGQCHHVRDAAKDSACSRDTQASCISTSAVCFPLSLCPLGPNTNPPCDPALRPDSELPPNVASCQGTGQIPIGSGCTVNVIYTCDDGRTIYWKYFSKCASYGHCSCPNADLYSNSPCRPAGTVRLDGCY